MTAILRKALSTCSLQPSPNCSDHQLAAYSCCSCCFRSCLLDAPQQAGHDLTASHLLIMYLLFQLHLSSLWRPFSSAYAATGTLPLEGALLVLMPWMAAVNTRKVSPMALMSACILLMKLKRLCKQYQAHTSHKCDNSACSPIFLFPEQGLPAALPRTST